MSMNCEDARLMISMLTENDLSKADTARMAAHLSGCARCRAYRSDIGHIGSKLAECLRADESYDDITDTVMSQLPVPTARPRLVLRPAWLVAPGLCALALVVILANGRFRDTGDLVSEELPTPKVQVQKHTAPDKPVNDDIAKAPRPSTDSPMRQGGNGVYTTHARHYRAPSIHQDPIEQPHQTPPEPLVIDDTPTPAQPEVIASVPADDPQGPMPGRMHLETPVASEVNYLRVASSDSVPCIAIDPPADTTAYVCVDVPDVTGVKQIRLYRVPVHAPSRPVVLAYYPQEEMQR